jgi:hypothetical protein
MRGAPCLWSVFDWNSGNVLSGPERTATDHPFAVCSWCSPNISLITNLKPSDDLDAIYDGIFKESQIVDDRPSKLILANSKSPTPGICTGGNFQTVMDNLPVLLKKSDPNSIFCRSTCGITYWNMNRQHLSENT